MFGILNQLMYTVKMANEISRNAGEKSRWSVFITNRSFLVQVFSLVLALLAVFGVPLPVDAEFAADTVYAIASGLLMVWAAIERFLGSTKVVWSRKQADQAYREADALSKALKNAGAK